MKGKMTICIIAAGALWGADAARAAYPQDNYDYARVERVEPVRRVVQVAVPREECWDEPVNQHYAHRQPSHTPVIFGAIIGGLIGNQFGSGGGRDAMTAAGAFLGGSIASDHARYRHASHSYPATQRRCRMVSDYRNEERLDGYRVTYSYEGRSYTTHLDHDPGPQLRVRVEVAPAP